MKTLLALILFTIPFSGAKDAFTKDMDSAMKAYSKSKTTVDEIESAQAFEEITLANPDEWTPAYYASLAFISASIDETNQKLKLDYLKKGGQILKSSENKWPKNHEFMALRALYHSAELMTDFRRAPQISPLIEQAAQEALSVYPNNPRAKYLLIQNRMGKASYFNQDLTPFCKEAKEVYDAFDGFKTSERYAPTWGKDLLFNLAGSCH